MNALPSIAPSLRPCAWCHTTHIADTICTCAEPCTALWCPMWPGNEYLVPGIEVPKFR